MEAILQALGLSAVLPVQGYGAVSTVLGGGLAVVFSWLAVKALIHGMWIAAKVVMLASLAYLATYATVSSPSMVGSEFSTLQGMVAQVNEEFPAVLDGWRESQFRLEVIEPGGKKKDWKF